MTTMVILKDNLPRSLTFQTQVMGFQMSAQSLRYTFEMS